MSGAELGLGPGDFAKILASSGLNQPEAPLIVPSWTVSKSKVSIGLAVNAPPRWTWRGHPSLAPVSNQGGNTTCVAHAACRLIETYYAMSAKTISLNADCAHRCVYGYPCSWPPPEVSSLLDALRMKGAPTTPAFVAGDVCPAKVNLGLVAVPRFERAASLAQVKAQIAHAGPVLGVMTLGASFEHLAPPYVYPGSAAGEATFNHAVLLIGFDDDDQGGMWECQNSFGAGWGEHGFFRIPYTRSGVLSDDTHPAYFVA